MLRELLDTYAINFQVLSLGSSTCQYSQTEVSHYQQDYTLLPSPLVRPGFLSQFYPGLCFYLLTCLINEQEIQFRRHFILYTQSTTTRKKRIWEKVYPVFIQCQLLEDEVLTSGYPIYSALGNQFGCNLESRYLLRHYRSKYCGIVDLASVHFGVCSQENTHNFKFI